LENGLEESEASDCVREGLLSPAELMMRDRPKSHILTWQFSYIRMLAGFRSLIYNTIKNIKYYNLEEIVQLFEALPVNDIGWMEVEHTQQNLIEKRLYM
jgi:hypothetical protein